MDAIQSRPPRCRWRPVRLFDRLADTHPQRRVSHAIDDRGYDVANNYQYLDLWRILSVILMRDTDKNGVYTLEGEAPCRAIYAAYSSNMLARLLAGDCRDMRQMRIHIPTIRATTQAVLEPLARAA